MFLNVKLTVLLLLSVYAINGILSARIGIENNLDNDKIKSGVGFGSSRGESGRVAVEHDASVESNNVGASFDNSEQIGEIKRSIEVDAEKPNFDSPLFLPRTLILKRVARDEPNTDLGKQLKKTLEELLVQIKEHVEHGKNVKDSLLDKVKEIRQKLKELNQDLGTKAKQLLEKVKDRFKDLFKNIFDDL